jgi:opacity protein-like surface antigen
MRAFIFSFLVVSSFGSSLAQDTIRAKTNEDDWALLFSFSGFGNLPAGGLGSVQTPNDASGGTTVQFSGIGAKVFTQKNVAVRAAVTASRIQSTLTGVGEGVSSTIDTKTALGIEAGAEYHFNNKRLSPYVGGLIGYSQGSSSSKTDELESSFKITGYGAAAIIGAEVFLIESLSIAAEYRLVYQSQSTTRRNGDQTTDGPKLVTIGIQSQGFLTLGFYF